MENPPRIKQEPGSSEPIKCKRQGQPRVYGPKRYSSIEIYDERIRETHHLKSTVFPQIPPPGYEAGPGCSTNDVGFVENDAEYGKKRRGSI